MKLSSQLLIIAALASAAVAARPARAADPTTADCLAATESSLALRNEHKLREARAQLLICSAASCPADMRDECTRRVGEVNAAIPTIVFAVKDAAGNDLVAVRVTMDGQPIAERLEGTALSIDPGAHTFTFETTGQAQHPEAVRDPRRRERSARANRIRRADGHRHPNAGPRLYPRFRPGRAGAIGARLGRPRHPADPGDRRRGRRRGRARRRDRVRDQRDVEAR